MLLMFALALTVSEILQFEILTLKSRLRLLGAILVLVSLFGKYAKYDKSRSVRFCASSHRFKDTTK